MMSRKCSTCQHVKRAEIDRRLAAGEPGNQIAHDYDLNPSSLHRHWSNCIGLSSSSAIMKEVSRATAAVACLPSKDDLSTAYFQLRGQIDQIVRQSSKARCRSRCPASTRSDKPWTVCRGSPALSGKVRKSMSRCK